MILMFEQIPEPQLALGPFLTFLVMAAISIAVSLIFKAKIPKQPLDDTEVDPSLRGSTLHYVIGRRFVTPIVGWVGLESNHDVQAGSAGSLAKFFGAKDPTKIEYRGGAVHFLSIGQGDTLYGVDAAGVRFYDIPITSTSHPSGTVVSTTKGSFTIYWGEVGQPANAALNTATGFDLSYPHICYVVWNKFTTGDAKQWPILSYDIKMRLQVTTLFSKPVALDQSTSLSNHTVDVSDGSITFFARSSRFEGVTIEPHFLSADSTVADIPIGSVIEITSGGDFFRSRLAGISASTRVPGSFELFFQDIIPTDLWGDTAQTMFVFKEGREGYNVGAIIHQLLFGAFPFGLEYDTANYNLTELEAVFDYFDTGETFELPGSLDLRGDSSIQDGLTQIASDTGIFISWDIVTAQYRFTIAKNTDSPTSIPTTDYSFNNKQDYQDRGYSVLESQLRAYQFKDIARRFKYSSVMIADDLTAREAKKPNSKVIKLNTITDLETASIFAPRKEREHYTRKGFKVNLSLVQGAIIPGKLFSLDGISGEYRLLEKELEVDKASFKCTFAEDIFSVDAISVVTIASGAPRNPGSVAFLDATFSVFETSQYFLPDTDAFHFLRIRTSPQSLSTRVFFSIDGTNFEEKAQTTQAGTGGLLVDALAIDTSTIIVTGPTLILMGPDFDYARDLTGEDALWKSGTQLAFINGEIFYLQKLTVTGTPNEYTMDGLIRARMGTVPEAHSIDDVVTIYQRNDIDTFTDPGLLVGNTFYVKSVPFSEFGDEALTEADVTAVSVVYSGGGNKPLDCINANTTNGSLAWIVGDDIIIQWGYRNIRGNAGAGLSPADEPYVRPEQQGTFTVEFLSGSTIRRVVENLTTNSYTYANAALVSDYSGEPSTVNLKVYNVFGGHRSNELLVTIVRV